MVTVESAELRHQLLEQVAYLIDEVRAVKGLVHRIPEEILTGHPFPGARSIKELYGLIAAEDEFFHLPVLEALAAYAVRLPSRPGEDDLIARVEWDVQSIDAILDRVIKMRTQVVAMLDALPGDAWAHSFPAADGAGQNLFRIAHAITQSDADRLRSVGERIRDSRLSSRD
jgi:hypothetical protein